MQKHLSKTDNEITEQFNKIQTRTDLAELLEIDESALIYYVYRLDDNNKYTTIEIPKKSSGTRIIQIPHPSLKIIQSKLAKILKLVYSNTNFAHGFVQRRSIVTNAKIHLKRRFVLNVDLEDFFGQINFGRVRGMFIKKYGFNPEISTILAQICCYDNRLPQGAPTSPIISNMICYRLDRNLYLLSKKYDCLYSRYADDITLSSNSTEFPSEIAVLFDDLSPGSCKASAGKELLLALKNSGFKLNEHKTRIYNRSHRQEVTGITVNKKLNIRRKFIKEVRAILYNWKKNGMENEEKKYYSSRLYTSPFKPTSFFKRAIEGKIEFIGMVRGKDDNIYLSLRSKLIELAPELKRGTDSLGYNHQPLHKIAEIACEGKTDYIHLETALKQLQDKGQFTDLKLSRTTNLTINGSQDLLKFLQTASGIDKVSPLFCIFDRDEEQVLKNAKINFNTHIADWGSNTWAIALPIPSNRSDVDSLCIEMLYSDAHIMQTIVNGKRLYLTNEFDNKTRRHKIDKSLTTTDPKAADSKRISIIDKDVFDINDKNIALPKIDFANEIAKNPSAVDFENFVSLFETISNLLK